MRATDIVKILRKRHEKNGDLFISECKTGSSRLGDSCPRLDGWAMKKSWTSPVYWGYEVKVSRNDFLNDDKWHSYLPFCTDFYFVCPKGVISPDEIPAEAGLIWVLGNRLYTKKKTIRRNIEIPDTIFKYLLMNRLVPGRNTIMSDREKLEYWRDQIEISRDSKIAGKEISKIVSMRIGEVISENNKLLRENQSLLEIKEFCDKKGISYGGFKYVIKKQLDSLTSLDKEDILQLKDIEKLIEKTLTKIKKITKGEI